jgi:hypothetical protein
MTTGYEPFLPSIELHILLKRRPELQIPIVETALALVKEKVSPVSAIRVDLGNLDGDENFTALKFRMDHLDGKKTERNFNIKSGPLTHPNLLVEGEPAKIW